MAVSLVMTMKQSDGQTGSAKVSGRIVTTVAKAKELRPLIEKIITMGRKARRLVSDAEKFASPAARGSDEWKAWRESENGKNWVRATAPALALRRRAFAARCGARKLWTLYLVNWHSVSSPARAAIRELYVSQAFVLATLESRRSLNSWATMTESPQAVARGLPLRLPDV
jgi:hypothetical protein